MTSVMCILNKIKCANYLQNSPEFRLQNNNKDYIKNLTALRMKSIKMSQVESHTKEKRRH